MKQHIFLVAAEQIDRQSSTTSYYFRILKKQWL